MVRLLIEGFEGARRKIRRGDGWREAKKRNVLFFVGANLERRFSATREAKRPW